MFNATTTTPYTSTYCMYNKTNASQVVCVVDSKNQTQYPYLPEYHMDISIFSYMYTLFLAFGCYSILNPASARSYALQTILRLAKYTITGYGLFKEHIYKPYVKHVHPKLLRILNIDDGINEIIIIRNGKVIHSFKTMELFVKNNPIKFVKEFSDDESDEEEEQDQGQEHISVPPHNDDSDLSDKVDYNKKCEQLTELIEAFKAHSLDDTPPVLEVPAPETNEVQVQQSHEICETDETDESDENQDTGNDIPDDYILDPTAYDFIIRNFYYEDEKTGETHSYVFKYDIFYKSEIVEKYDIDMIKDKYFSTRKFIGISLKTNNQKYNINLTSPNNYYISDNSIFNYSFLKWYMMEHYNIKLSRDYLISCIDNYVEMYRIHPGKKIIVHKNKFQIVEDETFVNDDGAVDTDNHEDVDSDTENDSDVESSSNQTQSESENKNDSIKVINANLEKTHEMCDIEILDYD